MSKPYLIAEVGVNYYDSARELNMTPLDAAKLYIDEAKRAGVDAVKFQTYKAETIVSKNSPGYWDMTQEPTPTQYELFKKFDHFGEKEYGELAEYCREREVEFMSTPFDINSADFLTDMVTRFKISSSDITNLPFLKYIAQKGKPILLSVGASTLAEIQEAVQVITEGGCEDLSLLHCVLSYPCKNEDANLNMIRTLKRLYPEYTIGYSDHTLPDEHMTILTTAYLLGADIIEKHFTLNKKLSGNDHYHAGDPQDFEKAVNNFKLIGQIRGQEQKVVLPCEVIPRREARRSLVFLRQMKKGEIIGEKDLIAKRPGWGVPPKFVDIVIGRELKCDVDEDTILEWNMI